jgi:predicted nucleic acid-binding protein
VHVQRVYLDTSVIGGYFDDEFREKTWRLFDAFLRGEARMVLSTLTGSEILEAPKRVRDFIGDFPCEKEIIEESDESRDLANHYIAAGALGEASRSDAEHIALATIAKVDVLVSWNFRHIVNLPKIRRYNSVNQALGYQQIEIRTPIEVTGSW